MPSYGDGQDLVNLQAQAPMGATPNPGKPMAPSQVAAAAAQGGQQPMQQQQVTPLLADTQRPAEPVTTGAASGPGAGPSVLNLQAPDIAQYQTAKQGIQALASNPTASPALKALAQKFSQGY
jgi:hypothetical protein